MGRILFSCIACLTLSCFASAQDASNWEQDIDHLAEQLSKLHKDAFHKLPKDAFDGQVAELKSKLPRLEKHEVIAEMSKLVASLGDGHTVLMMDYSEVHVVPVQFYWFKDGLFVTRAAKEHTDAFAGRVTKFGKLKVEQALAKLKPYLSQDNEWQFKNQGPRLLGFGEMLHVIGAWESPEGGSIAFEKDGNQSSIDCECVPIAEAKKIVWVTRTGNEPKYREEQHLSCWNDWLDGPESQTIYVRYNRCQDAFAFQRLVNESVGFVEKGGVQKFVIDLRGNGGGNSAIFHPLLNYLKDNKPFNQKGHLIVVVDRGTFSSALLNAMELKNATKAVIYGEPTGGKPNHYGDVRRFELPNSKLKVQYSTKYFVRVQGGDPAALKPDVVIEPTFKDWLDGRDPVIEQVLANL